MGSKEKYKFIGSLMLWFLDMGSKEYCKSIGSLEAFRKPMANRVEELILERIKGTVLLYPNRGNIAEYVTSTKMGLIITIDNLGQYATSHVMQRALLRGLVKCLDCKGTRFQAKWLENTVLKPTDR